MYIPKICSNFAAQNRKTNKTMTIIKSKVKQNQIPRLRAEIPENLSRAGRWLMEHPNGIGVIVNRRAVNK